MAGRLPPGYQSGKWVQRSNSVMLTIAIVGKVLALPIALAIFVWNL